jgi:hypothetical protein
MRQSAVLADEYVLGPNELEAEIQELREQKSQIKTGDGTGSEADLDQTNRSGKNAVNSA